MFYALGEKTVKNKEGVVIHSLVLAEGNTRLEAEIAGELIAKENGVKFIAVHPFANRAFNQRVSDTDIDRLKAQKQNKSKKKKVN